MLTISGMSGSTLSDRLGRARSAVAGLSARELSSLAGLSNAVVTRLENENRSRPAAQTVGALARALGVELQWLLDGTGPCVAARPDLDPEQPDDRAAIAEHIAAAVKRARDAHAMRAAASHAASDFTVDRSSDFDQTGAGR